jgi:Domain of Unknown Function with PDB structure (DUF3857)
MRALLWSAITLAVPILAGAAEQWQPISPQDLSMTSEPKAPGAAAVILYRQVDRDDDRGSETDYVRVKILSESARDRYSNLRLQYFVEQQTIDDFRGRTIHADGSVYPFDGRVSDEPDGAEQGHVRRAKMIPLPKVEVGSIVEYRWHTQMRVVVRPFYKRAYDLQWILNDDLFTREARLSLRLADHFLVRYSWPLGLPAGTQPPVESRHVVRLVVHEVPAFVGEEFMPPVNMQRMRVDFHYSNDKKQISDPDAFWNRYSKVAARYIDGYAGHSGAMNKALATIVDPGDSDETKLRKIYARVQQVHNDSYDPPPISTLPAGSFIERTDDVADIWDHQHALSWQLTWLFLGLARAAGFEADPIMLSTRDRSFLDKTVLDEGQLNGSAVRVKLGSKQIFADPGAAFTPFGALPWYETAVEGLRLTKEGSDWITTALPSASASRILRRATLQLSGDGTLRGNVTVHYSGIEAQLARLQERAEDAEARTKYLEGQLKSAIPAASDVKLTNAPGWSRDDDDLVAEYTLRIDGWAQGAGRRTLFTAGLFSAQERGEFTHDSRVQPIYFRFPYEHTDEVDIALPADLKVGSLPEPKITEFKNAHYSFTAERSNGGVHLSRDLSSGLLLLQANVYPQIRDFYQSIRAGDAQQMVLVHTSAAGAD